MIQYSKFNIHRLHRLFFYAFLILLPTQLGYHWWPSWAMVLGRRVDYLSPTFYLTDFCIVFIIIFWFIESRHRIWSFVCGIWEKKHACIRNSLFVFIFAVFNIFFATNRMVAVYAWVKVLEYVLFGVYVYNNKPKFLDIIFFLSIGVFYSSALAIVQFTLQHSVGGIFWFLGERTFTNSTPGIAQVPFCVWGGKSCPLLLRAYGTFPHPNVLGGFLAVMLPLIIFQISSKEKIFYTMTALLGMFALILTFSRSAWVVGLVGVLIIMRKSLFGKKYSVLFSVIILFAFFLFVVQSFHIQDESVVVRKQLNIAATTIWKRAPWIGIGLGNFLVVLPDFLPSRQIYFLQPAHNIYLLILSETGIIGFGLFSCLIFFIIRNYYFSRRQTFFWTTLAIFALGLVDHYPLTLQQGQLLTILFLSLSATFP